MGARMGSDSLKRACDETLRRIGEARAALSDAANPPGQPFSIIIPGLDRPITGERSLQSLPPGTTIRVAMPAPVLGAVYIRSSSTRPHLWMRQDGVRVTGVDVFASILDAVRCDGTITLLAYGLDPQ